MTTPIRNELALVPLLPEITLPPDHPAEKRIENLRKAARRVRQGGDEEAVHDARVATRRLTAVLDVWADFLAPKARRSARDSLRRMRRRLGAAREREVSLEQLHRALESAMGDEADALAEVAARERAKLPKDRSKVTRAAEEAEVERIAGLVRKAVSRGASANWVDEAVVARARERVERRREATLVALSGAFLQASDPALHAARVAAKKWRYGEEALAEVLGQDAKEKLSVLRDLQEALGANQDRAVLAALLVRAARRETRRENAGRSQALRSRAAALHAENARRLPVLAVLQDRLRGGPPSPSAPGA